MTTLSLLLQESALAISPFLLYALVSQMGSQMKKRFLTSRQPRPWRSGTRQWWRRSQQGVIRWPFWGPKRRHTSRRDGGERVAGTVNANYTTGFAFDLPGQCEKAKVISDGDKDWLFRVNSFFTDESIILTSPSRSIFMSSMSGFKNTFVTSRLPEIGPAYIWQLFRI